MASQSRIAWRFLSSKVSALALMVLILGVITAQLSKSCDHWWESYLQSLSTAFIGIALTVLLVNLVLELQSAELRRAAEHAALETLRRLCHRLPASLPEVDVPDESDLRQLVWVHRELEQAGSRLDRVTAGADEQLAQSLSDFRDALDAWSETLYRLETSTRALARTADRSEEYTALKHCTQRIGDLATKLQGELSDTE